MKFQKLRLAGFKSFVEATDFLIEPGLTGVVGPNGCGKSNLVEALRWVMGENSYKNMRGSGMEDVIFSGSGKRPARNIAEVGIVLDNSARLAPAAFNGSDTIEVLRRIARDEGSTYRINGREVRARDVQLLFADASSGARSPAMVRQGQIGEMIAAKPQARRRILEEAAGVAGLHSRRHEAELRLKAAEDNLLRLDDVTAQLAQRIESLKRQARQAQRYRALAGEIRMQEALQHYISWHDATAQAGEAETAVNQGLGAVAALMLSQAEAARAQGVASHQVTPLRDAEMAAGIVVQRLVLAREGLEGEEARAQLRLAELAQNLAQLQRDDGRERALIEDARAMLARLVAEQSGNADASAGSNARASAAAGQVQAAQSALVQSEAALATAQTAMADLTARRHALQGRLRDASQRLARLEAELRGVQHEQTALEASINEAGDDAALVRGVDEWRAKLAAAEADGLACERQLGALRRVEAGLRGPAVEAERKAQRLDVEMRTLDRMIARAPGGRWSRIVDAMAVAAGLEAALGAVLGDDLDAAVESDAPVHWRETADASDPALPEGVIALGLHVEAPPAARRRLAQIGLVERAEGARLALLLKPGQRLVSRQGDVWRWDGLTSVGDAPSAAARRLIERNRLADLAMQADAATKAAQRAQADLEVAIAATRIAVATENAARQSQRDLSRMVEAAREKHSAAQQQRARHAARLAALGEAHSRLAASMREAAEAVAQTQAALAGLPDNAVLAADLAQAGIEAAKHRTGLANAQAHSHALTREAQTRAARQVSIAREIEDWTLRQGGAVARARELAERAADAKSAQVELLDAPNQFLLRRRSLMSEIDAAEERRKAASDQRVLAEAASAAADRTARAALEALSTARENAARAEANFEARRQRRDELVALIAADLDCSPLELAGLAGLKPGTQVPAREAVEQKLEALRADRERLGAVNLRADTELAELEAALAALLREQGDLTEAIKRLRGAISSLNREGRERLQVAFDVVNGHFRDLFTTLFGGGTAELQLIESDDPLEAGLEIFARPPGKKPQTMTLLSGGEQALTAMALIFAVFLTNPSPICVLDEVDAPLDDANVERFCDLLDEMARRTQTRFLTITHNPITMSRMNRLFGVTMAEQGVSQLVSVDLGAAERLIEAG